KRRSGLSSIGNRWKIAESAVSERQRIVSFSAFQADSASPRFVSAHTASRDPPVTLPPRHLASGAELLPGDAKPLVRRRTDSGRSSPTPTPTTSAAWPPGRRPPERPCTGTRDFPNTHSASFAAAERHETVCGCSYSRRDSFDLIGEASGQPAQAQLADLDVRPTRLCLLTTLPGHILILAPHAVK